MGDTAFWQEMDDLQLQLCMPRALPVHPRTHDPVMWTEGHHSRSNSAESTPRNLDAQCWWVGRSTCQTALFCFRAPAPHPTFPSPGDRFTPRREASAAPSSCRPPIGFGAAVPFLCSSWRPRPPPETPTTTGQRTRLPRGPLCRLPPRKTEARQGPHFQGRTQGSPPNPQRGTLARSGIPTVNALCTEHRCPKRNVRPTLFCSNLA